MQSCQLSNDRMSQQSLALTFNNETSVTRPNGPASDGFRTSVFGPFTFTSEPNDARSENKAYSAHDQHLRDIS